MKGHETKARFILMRAEGLSYQNIGKALGISRATCSAWEQELKEQISEQKQDQLRELYQAYYMHREARIKQLGETLLGIESALGEKDLSDVSPEKLLDFKLKFLEALKEEYVDIESASPFKGSVTPKDILTGLGDLQNRLHSGDVNPNQALRESLVLGNMLKAYEAVEITERVEAMEEVIRGRGMR